MISRYCIFISAAMLMLVGCAGVSTQPSAGPARSDAGATDGVPVSPAEDAVVAPPSGPKPVMSRNQAVLALLERSQTDIRSGQRESAGASLERALRIEPRNAWLWQELAQLRLGQGQYAQAISLARKSISFAGKDKQLLAMDWRIIGNARVAQGSRAEAEQAFKRAEAIEQAEKSLSNFGFDGAK